MVREAGSEEEAGKVSSAGQQVSMLSGLGLEGVVACPVVGLVVAEGLEEQVSLSQGQGELQ